jgi:hypothetical protein
MKKKKKHNDKTGASRVQITRGKTNRSKNEIGLPEDTRTVYSEEPNPHDG